MPILTGCMKEFGFHSACDMKPSMGVDLENAVIYLIFSQSHSGCSI